MRIPFLARYQNQESATNLPLPKPLSLDAFCAQMAPHLFGKPKKASHIFTHSDIPPQAFQYPNDHSVDSMRLDEPSVDFMRLEESCSAQWCPVVHMDKDGEPSPLGGDPFPKPNVPDNTVGHVSKTSGYVFNTPQTNSAAHVPNTNMSLVNDDTHTSVIRIYTKQYSKIGVSLTVYHQKHQSPMPMHSAKHLKTCLLLIAIPPIVGRRRRRTI